MAYRENGGRRTPWVQTRRVLVARLREALFVDAVEVDRSFIDGLGADPEDSAIVAAVVSLGHALDLTVIAGGVETARQLSPRAGRPGLRRGQSTAVAAPTD